MNIEINKITTENKDLLNEFLDTIEVSKKSFAYYESRDLSCLKNHLVTLLYTIEGHPVAYGHLDFDGERVWLGICVSDDHHGRGYGHRMMNDLIDFSKENEVSQIYLSVYKENKVAISLYHKVGFVKVGENNKSYFMTRMLNYDL